jgi:hypothetical protein
VRAAVAQAKQRRRVGQHLAYRLVIAVDVVHHREEQVSVFSLGQVVVGDFVRCASLAGGDRRAAELVARLVIRRVPHDEELVPTRRDELAELRQAAHFLLGRFLVEDLAPQRRVAQALALLGDAQPVELAVARADRERIERGTDAEHDSDRPTRDLRGQVRALGACGMHRSQQPPPAIRILVAVGQQEPDRAARLLGEPRHPGEFFGFVVEIAVHAEGARTGGAQRGADAQQLFTCGISRRHHLSDRRFVGIGA